LEHHSDQDSQGAELTEELVSRLKTIPALQQLWREECFTPSLASVEESSEEIKELQAELHTAQLKSEAAGGLAAHHNLVVRTTEDNLETVASELQSEFAELRRVSEERQTQIAEVRALSVELEESRSRITEVEASESRLTAQLAACTNAEEQQAVALSTALKAEARLSESLGLAHKHEADSECHALRLHDEMSSESREAQERASASAAAFAQLEARLERALISPPEAALEHHSDQDSQGAELTEELVSRLKTIPALQQLWREECFTPSLASVEESSEEIKELQAELHTAQLKSEAAGGLAAHHNLVVRTTEDNLETVASELQSEFAELRRVSEERQTQIAEVRALSVELEESRSRITEVEASESRLTAQLAACTNAEEQQAVALSTALKAEARLSESLGLAHKHEADSECHALRLHDEMSSESREAQERASASAAAFAQLEAEDRLQSTQEEVAEQLLISARGPRADQELDARKGEPRGVPGGQPAGPDHDRLRRRDQTDGTGCFVCSCSTSRAASPAQTLQQSIGAAAGGVASQRSRERSEPANRLRTPARAGRKNPPIPTTRASSANAGGILGSPCSPARGRELSSQVAALQEQLQEARQARDKWIKKQSDTVRRLHAAEDRVATLAQDVSSGRRRERQIRIAFALPPVPLPAVVMMPFRRKWFKLFRIACRQARASRDRRSPLDALVLQRLSPMSSPAALRSRSTSPSRSHARVESRPRSAPAPVKVAREAPAVPAIATTPTGAASPHTGRFSRAAVSQDDGASWRRAEQNWLASLRDSASACARGEVRVAYRSLSPSQGDSRMCDDRLTLLEERKRYAVQIEDFATAGVLKSQAAKLRGEIELSERAAEQKIASQAARIRVLEAALERRSKQVDELKRRPPPRPARKIQMPDVDTYMGSAHITALKKLESVHKTEMDSVRRDLDAKNDEVVELRDGWRCASEQATSFEAQLGDLREEMAAVIVAAYEESTKLKEWHRSVTAAIVRKVCSSPQQAFWSWRATARSSKRRRAWLSRWYTRTASTSLAETVRQPFSAWSQMRRQRTCPPQTRGAVRPVLPAWFDELQRFWRGRRAMLLQRVWLVHWHAAAVLRASLKNAAVSHVSAWQHFLRGLFDRRLATTAFRSWRFLVPYLRIPDQVNTLRLAVERRDEELSRVSRALETATQRTSHLEQSIGFGISSAARCRQRCVAMWDHWRCQLWLQLLIVSWRHRAKEAAAVRQLSRLLDSDKQSKERMNSLRSSLEQAQQRIVALQNTAAVAWRSAYSSGSSPGAA